MDLSAKRVARFWAKVRKTDGCWEWTAAIDGNGYGDFRDARGHHCHASRYSWALHFGPIPDGLLVCHHCDNRSCVRPDHLFLGTVRDNAVDMAEKGRASRWRAEMTHCKWGHEFTRENTYERVARNKRGMPRAARVCRACARLYQRHQHPLQLQRTAA